MPLPEANNNKKCIERISSFYDQIANANKPVVSIGGDVACLIPTKDQSNNITSMVAASIMFEIISLISANLKK